MVETTTASEFQRKFSQIQVRARREPVEVTRHRRRVFVLMSADQYDRLLTSATSRGPRTADTPDQAIRDEPTE